MPSFVLKLDSCNLIKGNAVPWSLQTYGFALHIIKRICNGRLTTGYQDTVWADFFIDMGFARCCAAPIHRDWSCSPPAVAYAQRRSHFSRLFNCSGSYPQERQHNIHPLFLCNALRPSRRLLQCRYGASESESSLWMLMGEISFCFFCFEEIGCPSISVIPKLLSPSDSYSSCTIHPDTAAKQPVIFFRIIIGNRHWWDQG